MTCTPWGGERKLLNDDGKVVLTCEDVCGLVAWTVTVWTTQWMVHFSGPHKVSYTVDITADRNSTFIQRQTHRDEGNTVQTEEQTGQDWQEFGDQ